jgi:hypothetical protein
MKADSTGLTNSSNGVPGNASNLRFRRPCASVDSFQPARLSSILARAMASSSARLKRTAACFAFLEARSFASPAFWTASPASLLASLALVSAAIVSFCESESSLSANSSIRALYGYAAISRRIASAKNTRERVLRRDFNTTVSWNAGNLHVRVFHVKSVSRHSTIHDGPEDSPNKWTATSNPTSNAKNASAHPSSWEWAALTTSKVSHAGNPIHHLIVAWLLSIVWVLRLIDYIKDRRKK